MNKAAQRTALVTGATSGIGLATAAALIDKGFRVLVHGRTPQKAAAAVARLGPRAIAVHADLSSQAAVRRLAGEIKEAYPPLDVLVNNAGVWNSHRKLTEDGVESTFAVNHLAYFLLTALLHDHLTATGRIVCVSSDSHKQVKGMKFDDLGLAGNYHGLRSYAQSKLANLLFCYEYERRHSGTKPIYAVQPGLVTTDIGLKGNTWLHALAWRVRRKMSGHKTPAAGAATSIYLASAESPPESGLYYDDCRPKSSSAASLDPETAARLWVESERLTGERFIP